MVPGVFLYDALFQSLLLYLLYLLYLLDCSIALPVRDRKRRQD